MMCRMDRSVDTSAPIADDDAARRSPQCQSPQASVPDLTSAVAEAQRGDPDAFRALYRDTQPKLLRYLHALVGDDAEDIASETWLNITRDLHTFTGDYDNFRGWAATIARHPRRPPPTPVPAEDLAALPAHDDTATTAIDAVATTTAIALIATLPPDQAEAVLLRAVLGLDATR